MNTAKAGRWVEQIDERAWEHAVRTLRGAGRDRGTVVIAAHVGPDGDALGAALALHAALSRSGARTFPTVGERPMRIPAALADLPGADRLVPTDALPDPEEVDLLITVDAATPERLGTIARYLDTEVPTLVLDHHAVATPFGDCRLVAPDAAATVQIVAELLDRWGVSLEGDLATCLYVGLVTDTGRFGYAATDRSAMELGGRLMEAGVDHAGLTRRIYDTRSLGELRLIGRALDRLGFVPDVALVHTHVVPAELAEVGSGIEAMEALVDLLRSADVAEVALVLKPGPEGGWRASLRSHGSVDVARLAAAFGGGGHRLAAGFSSHGEAEDVVDRVVEQLRAA